MHSSSIRRVSGRLIVAATAILLAAVPLGASQAQPDQSTVPGKKFAAYEFGWYPINFVDHFDDALPSHWEVQGTENGGTVGTQHGMFTIYSGQYGTVGATLRDNDHDRGRWEIRLRGKRFETGNADYTISAELVPADPLDQHCGAQNISLASYQPTAPRANFYDRTLPDNAFTAVKSRMNLANDYWHTWAVEVTPRRVTWFVDSKVQRTEWRTAALSGVPMALRLQLTAVPGARMNESRLQVDTVRYFTLKSKNKKPVAAPKLIAKKYADAC